MKCIKCNAEIEQEAQFCPYCGTKVVYTRCCTKCGKPLDEDSDFCPYCGTKQDSVNTESEQIEEVVQPQTTISVQELETVNPSKNQIEELPQEVKGNGKVDDVVTLNPEHNEPDSELPHESKNCSKKWLWIVGVILLLGILGGGGYYFMSNKDGGSSFVVETDSITEIGDAIPSDLQSVEAVKARLTEILSKALKMYDEDAVNSYFSKEYRELFKKVKECDNKYVHDEPGFWNGSIWGGQDDIANGYEILRANTTSPTEAIVDVNLLSDYEGRHSEHKVSMSLVFENRNWFIDDILEFNYKESMEEYLGYWNEKKDIIDAYRKILDDYAKKGKDSADGNLYFLHDITGDGYSELWVQVCNEDGLTCKLLIYEFKNGVTSKIYQEEVGHRAHHSYRMKDNNVYLSYGHMADSSLSIFEYKDGKIQTREINEDSSSEQSFGQEVEIHKLTDKESLVYL